MSVTQTFKRLISGRQIQEPAQAQAPPQTTSDFALLQQKQNITASHNNTTASHNNIPGNWGTTGNTKRSGGKSAQGLAHYEEVLVKDHRALRQNTRSVIDKSTQARTILGRARDTIVGNGLKPDPRPAFKTLGITREAAKEWSEKRAELLNLWANSKDSDLTGHNNFYQNQGLIKWFFDRDGEFFIRLTYSDNPLLINPVQISFIDPNQIRGEEFTISLGPSTQETGVNLDANGKPESYKVWMSDPDNPGRFKNVTVPAFEEKTGRPIMIHGFKREWVGQTRGIPEISHSLQDYQDITSFTSSTIKKRTMESTLGLIMENEQQDPSTAGFSQLNAGSGAGVVVTTEESPTPTTPVNLGVDGVKSCTMDESTISESGSVVVLGAQQGDKLKAIPAAAPAEKTAEFVDGQFEFLAAAMRIPGTVAKMKMGKAHSASRAELGMYADIIAIDIDSLASDALNIIADAVTSEDIANGRMKAPGFSDPLLRMAWLLMIWRGNPLPDVDPLKTKMADKVDAEMGWSDLDTQAQKINGSSGEANRIKLTKQFEELPTDPFGIKALEQDAERLQKIEDDDAEEEEIEDDE